MDRSITISGHENASIWGRLSDSNNAKPPISTPKSFRLIVLTSSASALPSQPRGIAWAFLSANDVHVVFGTCTSLVALLWFMGLLPSSREELDGTASTVEKRSRGSQLFLNDEQTF